MTLTDCNCDPAVEVLLLVPAGSFLARPFWDCNQNAADYKGQIYSTVPFSLGGIGRILLGLEVPSHFIQQGQDIKRFVTTVTSSMFPAIDLMITTTLILQSKVRFFFFFKILLY